LTCRATAREKPGQGTTGPPVETTGGLKEWEKDMTKNSLIAFVGIAAFAAVASAAPTVSVKYLGTGKGQNLSINFNGNNQNVFVGQLRHQLSNASAGYEWLNGEHRTYCTDLFQYVTSTTKTYTIEQVESMPGASPMGQSKADALRAMFAVADANVASINASNDYATGFQLAIWEIVSDFSGSFAMNANSFASGNFKAKRTNGSALTASVVGVANSAYNAAMNYLQSNGQSSTLVGIASGTAQDQLILVPTPGVLTLAGLGGLLCTRRRRGN
jgi:hypothetical protein